MENLFGKVFTTIGSLTSNLLLKTKGDLKIQWGNKYIDLIKDGKLNMDPYYQKQIQNLVPKGAIIMWSGTNIPDGWVICNGDNGTPNLTNKFIKSDNKIEQGTIKLGLSEESILEYYSLIFIMKCK